MPLFVSERSDKIARPTRCADEELTWCQRRGGGRKREGTKVRERLADDVTVHHFPAQVEIGWLMNFDLRGKLTSIGEHFQVT